MRKLFFAALLLLSVTAVSAQSYEGLAPGLYMMIDGQPVTMKYETAKVSSWDIDNEIGTTDMEIARCKFHYKKHSSKNGVCNGKFIMVCDPERKAIFQSLRKYIPFVKTMTPENMLLIGFDKERKGRVFDATHPTVKGLNVTWPHEEFEWNKVADNVYEIDAAGLKPGEYGFLFRISNIASYKFDAAYTFGIE